jgi:quercetin dioxygenase-like cupin family protein
VELDGERMAVAPGSAVLIPPGVRHRAAKRMTILNVVVPPFEPADERLD